MYSIFFVIHQTLPDPNPPQDSSQHPQCLPTPPNPKPSPTPLKISLPTPIPLLRFPSIPTQPTHVTNPLTLQGEKLLGVQIAQHSPHIDTRREQTIARLWNITETLNVLYRENWTLMANKEIIKFQNEMIQSIKQDMAATDPVCNHSKEEEEKELTITAAFLYCLSLITTIGQYLACH